MLLRDAIAACGELLLGKGRAWDVLPKFFDNWHRIPHHLHPCQEHCAPGLVGKPESYYFPEELNVDRNAFPATPMGVDPAYTDRQVMSHLRHYFKGDNRLTDLANTINLVAGTGWYMPPCTLHAPGSLVTYELQAASDVSCIPESRVNDVVMQPDLLDRDLPVKVASDGFDKVCGYILSMIRCRNAGNGENFRREYFRPPVSVRDDPEARQSFVIYRTGRASERANPDLYSAKKTVVTGGREARFEERAAFGVIVLAGHGEVKVPGQGGRAGRPRSASTPTGTPSTRTSSSSPRVRRHPSRSTPRARSPCGCASTSPRAPIPRRGRSRYRSGSRSRELRSAIRAHAESRRRSRSVHTAAVGSSPASRTRRYPCIVQ